jgi:hypothetical protein
MTANDTKSKLITSFKKFLIFGGIFNFFATTLFVLPWTFKWYIKTLNDLNQSLNLGGLPLPSAFDPFSSVIINCSGICIVLIGALVIYSSKDPDKLKTIPFLNAIARLVFCFTVLYYIFYMNLARIIGFFGIMDGVIGMVFVYYYVRLNIINVSSTQKARNSEVPTHKMRTKFGGTI